jgi:DNA invertase Pin-like site-specific DNA recombinase
MADLIGYARVSRIDQNPDLQIDALNDAGCIRIFVDKASGAIDQRPELDRLLDQLRPGDVVCTWRLDRMGRSLRHLIELIHSLEERNVGFRSLQENLDTSTPTGRLIFNVFASLAEFERDLLRERTQAGLAAARARGRVGGRPTVMTPAKLEVIRSMYASRKHSLAAIAAAVNVSRSTVYRHLASAASTSVSLSAGPSSTSRPRRSRCPAS